MKNLVLESEGLLRVEGGCTIANDKIDGVFPGRRDRGQSAMAARFAGARFYGRARRLLLDAAAPHRIGLASARRPDQRLVAAAAGELLQNPEDTLRDAAKTLLDLIPH